MKNIKIPTYEDFLNYDGGHTPGPWRKLSEDWRCPGCDRLKFEILRWTKRTSGRGIVKGQILWDWLAPIHMHHDHSKFPRFDEVPICGQCNSVDGKAVRHLKLNYCFSFSPFEISQFITTAPHGNHKINFKKVEEIFNLCTENENGKNPIS